HLPTTPVQFLGHARPAVARKLQSDALDGVSQIDILVPGGGCGQESVVSGPAHASQAAQLAHTHGRRPPDLLLDVPVNRGFPVNACNIRCSSMRCKQPFKKSISSVC